ncbi:Peroxisomal membrane PEX30 [Hyphodiscus hymeniophilus]|uniref:Peroxisomal membrane PEX30 n=1 Tax=Hyphodiscus hymeniophilus TaxID=353542 RepID=A0A9P6VK31_9HELO|nr:Peroxisomal membrane PEX30 [Hyphodiscus hymeniophilus]
MYSRRYSPLSSTGWTGEKQKKGHKKADSEVTNTKHQKTLDEIVETLKVFTSRCNVLLDPLLELTDFLSTQRTATSATTRPALTILLIRILLITPLGWNALPHLAFPAKQGLQLEVASPEASEKRPDLPPRKTPAIQNDASLAASSATKRRPDAPGVKFTFILYENQRRWVGLGWTTSLFAYERAAWTDEHLNPAPVKEQFELPDVEGGGARWRWAEGSQWLVEGAGEYDEGGAKAKSDATDGGQGWIYYDNKWQNGHRGQDSWGRYTRRRKWYRDAELVEISPSTEITPSPTPTRNTTPETTRTSNTSSSEAPPEYAESVKSTGSKGSGFRPGSTRRRGTVGSRRSSLSMKTTSDDDRPPRLREADWGIGDDVRMALE